VLRQTQVVVTRKRKQPAAVTFHPDSIDAGGRRKRAAKTALFKAGELLSRERVEGFHGQDRVEHYRIRPVSWYSARRRTRAGQPEAELVSKRAPG
jgi:hypothetical protein